MLSDQELTELQPQYHILLVEDNDDDATWTMDALGWERHRCRVTRVEDGEEALAVLYNQWKYEQLPPPILMLLDLTLPKLGGLEVLSQIRKSSYPDLKNLPVVILTESKMFEDVQKALNLHAASYLPKPVKLADFVAAVKASLPSERGSEYPLEALVREMERFS
jgi:chemotaxis family two-component system response regulator Rcp1